MHLLDFSLSIIRVNFNVTNVSTGSCGVRVFDVSFVQLKLKMKKCGICVEMFVYSVCPALIASQLQYHNSSIVL